MKICLITPISQNVEPWIPIFEQKGVQVLHNTVTSDCDFIVCTGQAYIQLLENFHKTYPHIPLINYTWDFYKTVWERPNGYDWHKYREYLHKCVELWCPSQEVVLRLSEEGIDTSKCKIIKTWARFFDYDGPVIDKRYILQPLRPYLSDKNSGWLRQACNELDIRLFESNHKLTEEQFQKMIACCSFICCEYHEASTGGLTLLEGYRLGKPVVVSDSPYMGARDYFGDKAIYFNDKSYEEFKNTIKEVWENTPILVRKECEQFTDTHIPSLESMIESMLERLQILK